MSADLSSLGDFSVLKHSYIRTNDPKTYNDRGAVKIEIAESAVDITNGKIIYTMPKLSYSVIEIDF